MGILFDAKVCSSLTIYIVLHMTFRVLSDRERFSRSAPAFTNLHQVAPTSTILHQVEPIYSKLNQIAPTCT